MSSSNVTSVMSLARCALRFTYRLNLDGVKQRMPAHFMRSRINPLHPVAFILIMASQIWYNGMIAVSVCTKIFANYITTTPKTLKADCINPLCHALQTNLISASHILHFIPPPKASFGFSPFVVLNGDVFFVPLRHVFSDVIMPCPAVNTIF